MALDWVGIRGVLLASLGTVAASGCSREMGPSKCEGAMARDQQGPEGPVPSGWVTCDSGAPHREDARSCVVPDDVVGSCNATGAGGTCVTDDECGADELCNSDFDTGACGCEVLCSTDADCGTGQACYCDGPRTRCVEAECHTDDDCENGYFCVLANWRLVCHGPDDECRSPEDCGGECSGCGYDVDAGSFQCSDPSQCTAGRPFLVEGAPRLASLRASAEWCAAPLEPRELVHDDARVLAEHWAATGLAEHASVAAFARFALELLALGAPVDLVDACARALTDEIEHARLAFALATRYAGHAVGPGPLALAGALPDRIDLVAVACNVAREACVGETIAAIEAAEAERLAGDPDVVATLARIAADELRHAELGWRFLAWALARVDADEHARIVAELDLAIHEAARLDARGDTGSPAQLWHGRLDGTRTSALRRIAVAEVLAQLRDTVIDRLAAAA